MAAGDKRLTGKDVLAMLGLCSVIAGAGWIYHPLAPILAGAFVFVYCYVTALHPKKD